MSCEISDKFYAMRDRSQDFERLNVGKYPVGVTSCFFYTCSKCGRGLTSAPHDECSLCTKCFYEVFTAQTRSDIDFLKRALEVETKRNDSLEKFLLVLIEDNRVLKNKEQDHEKS